VNQTKTVGSEQEIASRLRRILRLAYLQSRRLVARHGLTAPQLLCLHALAGSPGLPPTALAREVGLSRATLTGILRRLEARRLVTRSPSPLDRRSSLLHLTELGSAAAESVGSPLGSRFSKAWRRLSSAEKQELCRALDTLAALMTGESRIESSASPAAERTIESRDSADSDNRLLAFPPRGRTTRGTDRARRQEHGAESVTPPAKKRTLEP